MEFQKDWNFEIDGKVTFLGILEKYEEQFHKMWKAESTRASYSRDYENYILPYVNDRPIEVLQRKDFDEIISKLPQTKAEEEKVYNESTLRHIRHLIKVVVKTAAVYQECEDVLWGSIYSLPDTADERLDEQEFTRLRKSLTIPEEKKTAEELLRDPQQTGQNMGLALMFCLGLRNQEACGVNFGDVKPMVVAPNCFCMWVYKSTKVDSNELQKSGKTRNMDRVVPIPTVLLKLLFERRTFLKEQILKGEIPTEKQPSELSEEEVETLIDGLPIACLDEQYSVRCSSDDLTKAGPALFQKIHLNEDELGLIEADLLNVDRTQEGIVEKDPTVYLFRRNLGTHLFLLGLVPWEIQYVLGHDIEDPGEFRSFFRNEEKLYPIWKKMSKRPIVNDLPETITEYGDGFLYKEDTYKEKIKVTGSGERHIRLELSQHEPLDKTTVMIRCSDAHVEGEVIQEPNPESFRATVNIGKLIDKIYRRAKKSVSDNETEIEPDNLG